MVSKSYSCGDKTHPKPAILQNSTPLKRSARIEGIPQRRRGVVRIAHEKDRLSRLGLEVARVPLLGRERPLRTRQVDPAHLAEELARRVQLAPAVHSTVERGDAGFLVAAVDA